MHIISNGNIQPWQSVQFLMREEDIHFFMSMAFISIIACWMTVIHIPFTQFNVMSIGLGYYMILKFSL